MVLTGRIEPPRPTPRLYRPSRQRGDPNDSRDVSLLLDNVPDTPNVPTSPARLIGTERLWSLPSGLPVTPVGVGWEHYIF